MHMVPIDPTKINAKHIQSLLHQQLPTTQEHIMDLLQFQFKGNPLNDLNIFTQLYTITNLSKHNPNKILTPEEFEDIFGNSSSTTSEHDISEYDPDDDNWNDGASETDIESETECEDEDDTQIGISITKCINRTKKQNFRNTHYYHKTHNYVYLGDCMPQCAEDGMRWIQCDGCDGWKCYDHIHQERNIDLDTFECDFIEQMNYLCDACTKMMIDTVSVHKKYLETFNEKYFGIDGVQNYNIIHESNDAKWRGLSIDILLDHAAECKWSKELIKKDIMDNFDIINDGKILFLDLYIKYKTDCMDTKWEVLFNANNESVIAAFITLKKQLIQYIMNHIEIYYDHDINDITQKT